MSLPQGHGAGTIALRDADPCFFTSHALKLRKHLLKQLEKLQAESASGIDVSQFEAVDGLLEKYSALKRTAQPTAY